MNTDKSSTDINNDKIIIRQSEKGLVLNATIKAKDGTNYDLSGKTVQFAENKDDAKLVLDDNVQIDSSNNGVIHYTLNQEVYSASGTAWFEIITNQGDVIDTTKNFYIDVLRDAEINVANDNYISSLDRLIAHIKAAGDQAKEQINDMVKQLTDDVNSKKQEADNISADLTKKFDDKMTDLNSQLSDYQTKYDKLSTDWSNELKTISDQATSDINAKYAQKLVDLQNDYNSWKTKTVADFNATVDPIKQSIEKNTTDVSNITKQVNDTLAQMNTLKQSFDKIDFTKFVTGDTIKNYYTKTEVDNIVKDLQAKMATAGAVKTVDGVQPDTNGNVQTDHYTKAEANKLLGAKLSFVKCDSPQAAYDASKKAAADGSPVIAIYDMDDGPTSAVIDDKTVTISTLNDAINALQTQVNGLSSLQSVVDGKADKATVFLKTDAETLKTTLENEIANAGKVKTVNNIQPDSNGNITIPAPNLSSKANQSDLNNTNNRVSAIETGYMKKPTVISKADYDKLSTKDPNTLYEITE